MKKYLVYTLFLLGYIWFSAAFAAPRPRITVIMKSSESEYWQIVMDGVRVAGEELNVDVIAQWPVAESDIDKQIAMLENAISTRPDAIVLAPSAAAPLVPAIEKAAEAGIPMIIIDSAANTDKYLSFMASDNEKIGIMAAEEMATALKKKFGKAAGKVAGISFISGAGSIEKRQKSFEKTIRENYPDIEIVGFGDAQGKIGVATNITQDFLTRYSDLKGIFASNQPTGDDMVRALDIAGRDDLAVVVVDAGPNEVWGVKNGLVDSIIVQSPWLMGYMGVEYALKAIKGEKLPKYVNTGIMSITKDKIDSGEADKYLNPVHFSRKATNN